MAEQEEASTESSDDDGVVDADFEVVDEDWLPQVRYRTKGQHNQWNDNRFSSRA